MKQVILAQFRNKNSSDDPRKFGVSMLNNLTENTGIANNIMTLEYSWRLSQREAAIKLCHNS